VSSASDGADQLLATRKAGEDFVSKPIDPRKLVATVRANGRHARQVSDTVSRDSLTGVLKRGFINEYLTFELERAARLDTCTSVAMIDIDMFKAVNDQHGHPAGDLVIRTLASVLRQQLRASDGIGRVGGEEFLAVLPHCSVAEASAIMESALHRFSETRFSSPAGDFSCTFSAGIAEAAGGNLTETQLIGLADRALYEAKRAGRNQVHAAPARAKRARH
jgi:diguanylate cyclase (GGDEF)-like protein